MANVIDPYRLPEPFVISFSGGRTSAYLLRKCLDSYGGRFPADGHVLFANTGKEREETLQFVNECSQRWSVNVHWLEYLEEDPGYTVVNLGTASRRGEPFRKLIQLRKMVPNPVSRICTSELKIRVMKKWMQSHGYQHWTVALGLRRDEPHRVARLQTPLREPFDRAAPLFRAQVTEPMILNWWKSQDFDLQLQTHEGNCDLCFVNHPRPEGRGFWPAASSRLGSEPSRGSVPASSGPLGQGFLHRLLLRRFDGC